MSGLLASDAAVAEFAQSRCLERNDLFRAACAVAPFCRRVRLVRAVVPQSAMFYFVTVGLFD
jgi:hypothetical protein